MSPQVDPQSRMTQLLSNWSESRQQSIPELVEVIYKDLRQIAQGYMRESARIIHSKRQRS